MKDEPQKKLRRPEIKEQLEILVGLFQKLPKSKLKQLEKKINKINKVNEKSITKQDSIQDTINYLRVCIKYSLLDIESLRREIIILKKLLKENGIN